MKLTRSILRNMIIENIDIESIRGSESKPDLIIDLEALDKNISNIQAKTPECKDMVNFFQKLLMFAMQSSIKELHAIANDETSPIGSEALEFMRRDLMEMFENVLDDFEDAEPYGDLSATVDMQSPD